MSSKSKLPYNEAKLTVLTPDYGIFKGTWVREKLVRVDLDSVSIPILLVEGNRHVTLKTEVLFESRLAFLVTLLRGLTFLLLQHVHHRTVTGLKACTIIYV